MSLSRTHIAFLGIISIFTGLIAPGTQSEGVLLSYLMTDVKWIVGIVFISLVGAFILASMRIWSFYEKTVIITIIGICTLFGLTLFGDILADKSGLPAQGLSWGWIFLLIGVGLLGWSYMYREDNHKISRMSDTIDTIIGMIGGFALASIALIIALSSFSFFSKTGDHAILGSLFQSGSVEVLSGGVQLYGDYSEMPYVSYRRADDTLLLTLGSGSTKSWKLVTPDGIQTGSLKESHTPILIGKSIYTVDGSGYAHSGSRILLGSRVIDDGGPAIVHKIGVGVVIISNKGTYTHTSTGILSRDISLSSNMENVGWKIKNGVGASVVLNGNTWTKNHNDIMDFEISPDGRGYTARVKNGTGYQIVRNDITINDLPPTYLSGSYRGNGLHTLYITHLSGKHQIYYDGLQIGGDLEAIRDHRLDREGSSYSYFGRPLGEEKWCFFTRYRGNICGIEAYMNPRVSADGSSVIYAMKKNGKWSIYRNTSVVVPDVGYDANDIRYDYAYYDLTNPRTYVFIERDPETRRYQYRKNGVLIPGTWEDVSTEIAFGYDNHIITVAKNNNTWKIIEF